MVENGSKQGFILEMNSKETVEQIEKAFSFIQQLSSTATEIHYFSVKMS
ncbi:hypothetical protein [Alkalihalobacterium alkalinitrilicum]|nr:hypothetical protein [Alkalihalobacterium alkalinitrilicum]